MNSTVSIKFLHKVLMPVLKDTGSHYKKCTPILARPAVKGEHITTWTSSGKETENTAGEFDFVVKNNTIAEEQYIVDADTFSRRYKLTRKIDEQWAEYLAMGEILALCVDSSTMELLGKNDKFLIEAPWGNNQPVQIGDYLAAPLPGLDQIYRIDREEFFETYESS